MSLSAVVQAWFRRAEQEFCPGGCAPIDYRSAPLWRRLIAYVVDVLLGFSVLALLTHWGVLFIYFAFFLWFLYLVFRDVAFTQGSLGKRVTGLQVVNVYTGKSCLFHEKALRNMTSALFGPLELVFMLAANRRRFGDWLARSVVISMGSR